MHNVEQRKPRTFCSTHLELHQRVTATLRMHAERCAPQSADSKQAVNIATVASLAADSIRRQGLPSKGRLQGWNLNQPIQTTLGNAT